MRKQFFPTRQLLAIKIMDLELQSLKHMQVFIYLQQKKNVFTTLTKIYVSALFLYYCNISGVS